MTISRGYTPNRKFWDHIGRVTPNFEYSESHRLTGNYLPARWLPVQRLETENEAYKVISAGKVVALDQQGGFVPAGMKKAFNVATGSTAITYAAADVTYGTIDITTGVAVTAAQSYTESVVTAALRERGLIRHDQRAFDYISWPVGVAAYDVYQAAGADSYNPATLTYHNFRPQATVALLCDWALTYPVLPAKATTEAVTDNTAGGSDAMELIFQGTTSRASAANCGFFTATQIHAVTRYASLVAATDNVVAFVTVNYPIAHDTTETPFATNTSSCLVREVQSISAIAGAGDFYVDYDAGVIFLYEAGGDAVPSPWVAGTTTLTYYHYATEGSGTNTPSTYACATGNLEYGDFVTFDSYSNIIKATLDIGTAPGYYSTGTLYSVDPEYDTQETNATVSAQVEAAVAGYVQGIIGQVVGVNVYGEGIYSASGMERVRTSFDDQTLGATYRQPGSATAGRSDQLTYAGGAERMVIINLMK